MKKKKRKDVSGNRYQNVRKKNEQKHCSVKETKMEFRTILGGIRA